MSKFTQPPETDYSANRSQLPRQMIVGVILLNLVVAAIISFSLYHSKHNYDERAEVITRNISQVLDENISGVFAKVEIAMQVVADEAERQLATNGAIQKSTLDAFIIRQHSRLPEITAFRATNAAGDALYGPQATPTKTTSLAHRDYFVLHRDNPKTGLVISKPLIGGISGKWMIILSRRISQPDGTFAGLVYTGVTIDYLTKTFSKVNIGKHGMISLIDSDLTLVARYQENKKSESSLGQKITSERLLKFSQSGKISETYVAHSVIDHVERVFSVRTLELSRPFYIAVALATSDYLGEWHAEILRMSLAMFAFLAITVLFTRLILREWQRKKETEDELRKSKLQLSLTTDNLPHSYVYQYTHTTEETSQFLFVSKGVERVHPGITAEALLKDAAILHRLIESDQIPALIEAEASSARNLTDFSMELRFRHPDGELHCLRLQSRPRRDANGQVFWEGAATDITELKRAEEERIRLEKQLLHAQKLESLGVLAGGIAHDFNNILMSIMGNTDLALIRISKESPAVDNLHRIEQSAARAADLAKQMLAYSGKGRFVIENIDLNLLLEETLLLLEVSISKKATLRLNPFRPLATVEADATQIRQIIMNLVINASEAIGDNSGVITITTGCLECDRSYLKNVWLDENIPAGLYVYLEIADTGCGMDKETLTKLFDPFFTTKFTGRGLGMAAVLGIVRGHKGAIKVYSEPDKGTTFKILLPASVTEIELSKNTACTAEWKGSGRVLLVDDEESIRGIGTEMLRELGFEVITAEDGRDAVKIFTETPDIDFVILDLTMPQMDGEQCFRELRQQNSGVKVIMSSGFSEQDVTEKFAGKGLAGFIQKPYTFNALKEAIKGILNI